MLLFHLRYLRITFGILHKKIFLVVLLGDFYFMLTISLILCLLAFLNLLNVMQFYQRIEQPIDMDTPKEHYPKQKVTISTHAIMIW